MNTRDRSTRRLFFWQAGAALSAPLAVATAQASARSVGGDGRLQARLAAFEDVDAIRGLHQTYARLVNAGAHGEIATLFAEPESTQTDETIRTLLGHAFGAHDVIEVAPDRKTATARIHCTVETETAIESSCTLVEMARQQGEGLLRHSERRVLESAYVKRDGVWKIARSQYVQA